MKLAKILFVLAFVVVLAGCGAKPATDMPTDDSGMVATGTNTTATDNPIDTGSTVVVIDNSGSAMTGNTMTGNTMTGDAMTGTMTSGAVVVSGN